MPYDENDVLHEMAAEMPSNDLSNVHNPPDIKKCPKCKVTLGIENAFLAKAESGSKMLVASGKILACSGGDEFVGLNIAKMWFLDRFMRDENGAVTSEETKNWAYFKRDMEYLQIDPPQDIMIDMPRICTQLIGIAMDAALVPNKDTTRNPNLYINEGARRRELEEGAVRPGSAAEPAPF